MFMNMEINESHINFEPMKRFFSVTIFCFYLTFGQAIQNSVVEVQRVDSLSNNQKILKNSLVEIKIQLEGIFVNFEVISKNKRFKVQIASEQGKLSFTNKQCIIAYQGNLLNKVSHVIQKSEFLLIPFEDVNKQLIFYRIPLNLKNGETHSAVPFFLLKEAYCLFNLKTSKMIVYEEAKIENLKKGKTSYVTNISVFHLDRTDDQSYREFFSLEKEVKLLENAAPITVKNTLIALMRDFYDNYTINAYFH